MRETSAWQHPKNRRTTKQSRKHIKHHLKFGATLCYRKPPERASRQSSLLLLFSVPLLSSLFSLFLALHSRLCSHLRNFLNLLFDSLSHLFFLLSLVSRYMLTPHTFYFHYLLPYYHLILVRF